MRAEVRDGYSKMEKMHCERRYSPQYYMEILNLSAVIV